MVSAYAIERICLNSFYTLPVFGERGTKSERDPSQSARTNAIAIAASAGPAASTANATWNDSVAWNSAPTTTGTVTLPICHSAFVSPVAEAANSTPATSAMMAPSSSYMRKRKRRARVPDCGRRLPCLSTRRRAKPARNLPSKRASGSSAGRRANPRAGRLAVSRPPHRHRRDHNARPLGRSKPAPLHH